MIIRNIRTPVIFIGVCILTGFAIIYRSSAADTLSSRSGEVRVEAASILAGPALEFTSNTILDSSVISRAGARQVNEILSFSPGLFVRDYGGLGGIKTVSLRGAAASQTLVLIDGMRINSTQNGSIDLGTLPVGGLDKIEIARGGMSAAYGSNAMNGVINIVSEDEIRNFIDFNYSYGSFDTHKANFAIGRSKKDKIPVRARVEYISTEGDFPIPGSDNIRRENAYFGNMNINIETRLQPGNWKIRPRALFRLTERGIPGAYFESAPPAGSEEFTEAEAIALITGSRQFSGAVLNTGLMYRRSESSFTNPDNFLSSDKFQFSGNELNLQGKIKTAYKGGYGEMILELLHSDLAGDFLEPGTGSANRQQIALGFHNIYENLIANFEFSSIVRLDYVFGDELFIPYHLGIAYKGLPFNARLKTNFSNNFRLPSFNEMYYMNYGNSDLESEESLSIDFALETAPVENLFFTASAFFNQIENQIISVPLSPVRWSAENIGKVNLRGIELSANGAFFDDRLNILLNYTIQEATDKTDGSRYYGKEIIYTPKELISGIISARQGNFCGGVRFNYSSYRYSLPGNEAASVMPEYLNIDIFLDYKFDFHGIKYRAYTNFRNITGEEYQVIKNYPMPGISFDAGLSIIWNQS
jgi:vitamin B12 transporter